MLKACSTSGFGAIYILGEIGLIFPLTREDRSAGAVRGQLVS
jgi:hypothetical protein